MRTNFYPFSINRWTSSIILLLVLATTTYGWDGSPLSRPITLVKPPTSAAAKPAKPVKPVTLRSAKASRKSASNDPVRFTVTGNKSVVSVNDPFELTIRAELLDIPSSLMFFTEEASAFRLKVLPPPGFVVTGGTYQDMIGDKLSLKGKSMVSYTLQGYFEATTPTMCFRLLRGSGQADNNSLFVEKGSFCLQSTPAGQARLMSASKTPSPGITSLNATVEGTECFVITNKQSGQYVQATTANTVEHVAQASNQANQRWKFESMSDGLLRISSEVGPNQYMYVDEYMNDQPIRLGPDNAASTKYRWTKELVSGSSYRVRSQNMPWDQQYAGSLPGLQIWGDVTNYSLSQTYNWEQFYFQSVGCSTSVATLSVTPAALTGIAASGSTQSVAVTSNVTWNASSVDSWISLSPSSGSNDGSFTVVVQVNSGASRTGYVNVTGGGVTRSIQIDQLGSVDNGLVSGACYVIKSQIGGSTNTLQAMTDNTVQFQLPAGGQASQIWKAEGSNNSYKFITQTGTNQVMYVNSLQTGQSLLLGPDVTGMGIERYRWSLVASNNGGFRVYGGPNQNTWDHTGAGSVAALQLYGTNTDTNDGDWNAPYRRFSFTPTTCPTVGCVLPSLSLGAPICNGTSTYTVPFTVSNGAALTVSAGTLNTATNQVVNVPVGVNLTVTASIDNCIKTLSVASPICNGSPSTFASKRWLGLRMVGPLTISQRDYVDLAVTEGINIIGLTVNWEDVEQQPGVYNFSSFRNELDYCISKGLKIYVIADLKRGNYIPDEAVQLDNYGQMIVFDNKRYWSFNHQGTRTAAKNFFVALANYLNDPALRTSIVAISSMMSNSGENNYQYLNRIDPSTTQERHIEADWSTVSLTKYHDRLRGWFNNNIESYRAVVPSFTGSAFEQIVPPNQNSPNSFDIGYPFPDNKLWYMHRHLSLKEWLNEAYSAVRYVNTDWNLMVEVGHINTALSPRCATLGLTTLIPPFVQGAKINDETFGDHNVTANVALRDRAPEKWAAQEVGFKTFDLSQSLESDYINQGLDAFKYGNSMVVLALFGNDTSDPVIRQQNKDRLRNVIQGIKAVYPIGSSFQRPVPVGTVHLSLSAILGSIHTGYQPYRTVAESGNGNNAVTTLIDEDVPNAN